MGSGPVCIRPAMIRCLSIPGLGCKVGLGHQIKPWPLKRPFPSGPQPDFTTRRGKFRAPKARVARGV